MRDLSADCLCVLPVILQRESEKQKNFSRKLQAKGKELHKTGAGKGNLDTFIKSVSGFFMQKISLFGTDSIFSIFYCADGPDII